MNHDFFDFGYECGKCDGDPADCVECRRAVSNKVRKGLREAMDTVMDKSLTKL